MRDGIRLFKCKRKPPKKGHRPQKIKLIANQNEKSGNYCHRHSCPFTLMTQYIKMRGVECRSEDENFFICRDGSPVHPEQANKTLKLAIQGLGLDNTLYLFPSLRIGCMSDLIKFYYSIDEVRKMGHWKSNVVFKYIRN